ncbi:hypothetical protein ACFL9S_06085 [Erwinia sp. AnSW2-5]|uniref:hypothetical protein n=1 Tax=Erwinia sp. AnSW2-5 TaxID=3367692 RepID=UPI0038581F26
MLKVVSEIWKSFSGHVDLAVGIFTLTGVVLSLFALFYSARSANAGRVSARAAKEAAKAAKDSARIAQEALDHARKSSRREEFTRLFNQHNTRLDIVKTFLDGNEGAGWLKTLTESVDHHAAFNLVQTHSVFSPYMRILHQLLKHIDDDVDATPEEQKKDYALVRSLIHNEVLFLIAVNTSYVIEDGAENAYADYQRLLQRIDFFEHAQFYHVLPRDVTDGKTIIDDSSRSALSALKQQFNHLIRMDKNVSCHAEEVMFHVPVILACIFDNPWHAASKNCIEKFIHSIVPTFEVVKAKFLGNYARNVDVAYMFGNIIGRYAVPLSADLMVSDISKNNITQKDLDSFPVANEAFIRSAVADLKTGKQNPAMEAFYCKLIDHRVYLSSPSDFEQRAQDFLSWIGHLQKLEEGHFTPQVQAEVQHWQSFRDNVLLHRLA